MEFLYHIILGMLFLVASPLIAVRMLFDARFREDALMRLRGVREAPAARGGVWIHAASVGEVRVAQILLRHLRQWREAGPRALSVFTGNGCRLARRECADPVFCLPPDLFLWIDPLLEKLAPGILILVEAEFWPGLLWRCRRRKIPVVLVNGRISEKSFRRYRRCRSLFLWMTAPVSFFCMRTHGDAERMAGLGVPAEKISVTGNLKFDAADEGRPAGGLGTGQDAGLLVVCGSTRPGDEAAVLYAARLLHADFPQARFVLAPRHLERVPEVESLLRASGLPSQRHSQGGGAAVILVDTLGELNAYYRRCHVAFVGGGFDPRYGGHNVLEPALHGRPVVFGPHMDNFAEETSILLACGGGVRVADERELYEVLRRLLTQPEERRRRGEAAAAAVQANRGAALRSLTVIQRILSSGDAP